jgi:hypothetical protein
MIYIDSGGFLNLSKLHENQQTFVKSKYLHTGIVGGYQSGKSTAAVAKVITKLLINPGVPIAYYLPIYSLFDDMLLPKLEEVFENLNWTFKHNQQKSKIYTPYGEIWMRSMDNPDSIVSYSVGYSIVDEVDLVHPNKRVKAMQRISSRNSYKKNTPNQIDFVSTPEGFAYMWKFFVKQNNENKLLLNLKTRDNVDNLADGYIQGLKEQYDERQLKAYLDGEFVNLESGTIYYKFDRKLNHSDETIRENDLLFIGIDFNIGNMHAVVHVKRNGNPIAVDEISKVYDTQDMCNLIKNKYGNRLIFIYPDASGKNRSTNADKTDIEILRQYGFKIMAKSINPPVEDRIKNMNRMFCDGNNKRRYLVNTNNCQEYTEALEKMPRDKNGAPDKTSGFDHITEAGGYFIYYEYPIYKLGSPIM